MPGRAIIVVHRACGFYASQPLAFWGHGWASFTRWSCHGKVVLPLDGLTEAASTQPTGRAAAARLLGRN
jgi:hypothetical protein